MFKKHLLLCFLILSVLTACLGQETPAPPIEIESAPVEALAISIDEFLAGAETADYLPQVDYAPEAAKYYDLLDEEFQFTPAELEMLAQNGFVLTDDRVWDKYLHAYAYIYWQDLPVLVTTDSILHAMHQSYDDMLKAAETEILRTELREILVQTQNTHREMAADNDNPDLAPLYADVDVYIAVALAMLEGDQSVNGDVAQWVVVAETASERLVVDLFGAPHPIDFTLFKPRGHYADSPELTRYFRAMSWLAQVDFRLVDYSPVGQPIFQPGQLAAAIMLREALRGAQQLDDWLAMDALFTALVGRSDNMLLTDLAQFMEDAGLETAASVFSADHDQLLTLLTTNDYGQQRISGQIYAVAPGNAEPVPRPVSLMLFGQRFAIDSYVMGNLVFDRLQVNGELVKRPFPSSLDVMYALGNDRAAVHLQDELATYGYQGNLLALRQTVAALDEDFWRSSGYNQWLAALRTLHASTTGAEYPQAMRTAAWADKMLHTQTGSWARLRHDNLLYVKQSVTGQVVCEYPAGYVEPYPAFYAAVAGYAESAQAAFAALDTVSGNEIRQRSMAYLARLSEVARQLQVLAEKELRQEEFAAEEELFLKSIAIRQVEEHNIGCGGPEYEVHWDGWYADLFFDEDESSVLIADVHTNHNTNPFGPLPPGVLHVGTGPAAALFFVADTDEGPVMYVGPAFTYYEVLQTGMPPQRLTDGDWQAAYWEDSAPAAPAWTSGFRLSAFPEREVMQLPTPAEVYRWQLESGE